MQKGKKTLIFIILLVLTVFLTLSEMPPFSGQKEVNNIIKYINILSYYYS